SDPSQGLEVGHYLRSAPRQIARNIAQQFSEVTHVFGIGYGPSRGRFTLCRSHRASLLPYPRRFGAGIREMTCCLRLLAVWPNFLRSSRRGCGRAGGWRGGQPIGDVALARLAARPRRSPGLTVSREASGAPRLASGFVAAGGTSVPGPGGLCDVDQLGNVGVI